MFDTVWQNEALWRQLPDALAQVAIVQAVPDVAAVALLDWQEHCLECSPPDCYRQCSIYRERADQKCVRMEYGFVPDARFSGLFPYGIDCRFRRWAKIESRFHGRSYTLQQARAIERLSREATGALRGLSSLLSPISATRKPSGALIHYRGELLSRLSQDPEPRFDAFLLECYAIEREPVRLVVQCDVAQRTTLRRRYELQPGHNLIQVAFEDFAIARDKQRDTRVFVWPEDDREARLVFTWLDFVRFAPGAQLGATPRAALARAGVEGEAARPAEKIKCVAWDLDRTLWNGVLIESDARHLQLSPGVLETILELDRRGVIQTVASKNTHEEAWRRISELGLADYFVYPAINWSPKSENLRQIAARLNIGLDTFALIDDAPFERAEVASSLPMVRVYSDQELSGLLARPELDLPITEMSAQRRLSYLAESRREALRTQHAGSNLDFLRTCGMRMDIFVPETDTEKERCLELVQRSNQLNLSSRRYGEQEFAALLADPGHRCYGFRCSDNFGDYGIVGFLSLRREPTPSIEDLVISCRVAQKHVEHALITWLGQGERARGKTQLSATLVKTARNKVLAEVFRELPFTAHEDEQTIRYVLDLASEPAGEGIVSISFRGEQLP